MTARKPKKPARAPDDREREATDPGTPVDLFAFLVQQMRSHEANGHIIDYVHGKKNGASMLRAVLLYLQDGEPLPPLLREWLVQAISGVLKSKSKTDVLVALELLGQRKAGKLGTQRQPVRETTRIMLERIASQIERRNHLKARHREGAKLDADALALSKQSDRAIVRQIAAAFRRSGDAAWQQWCVARRTGKP